MSLVSDFIAKVAPDSFSALGTELISIGGGTGVAAVLDETRNSREYMGDGFAPQTALSATVRRSVWDAAYLSTAGAYVGKSASVRSVAMRIEAVEIGAHFVTIRLTQKERA